MNNQTNPAFNDPEVQLIFSYMTGQIAKFHRSNEALAKRLFEVTSR